MSIWTLFSNASSIITCILFLFFVIGKTWMLFKNKKIHYETLELIYRDDKQFIRFNSSTPINWIKIYNINDPFGKATIVKSMPVEIYDTIYSNFELEVNLNCGIPSQRLIFERFDYMHGEMDLICPNMDGIPRIDLNMKHTFLSFIFHIVN